MTCVVGVVGCTASGKTMLTKRLKLQSKCDIYIISCDDFIKPTSKCPTFDLEGIPWPDGEVPNAFKARGNADLNSPDSIAWFQVLGSIHKCQLQIEEKLANATPKTPPQKSVIVVEGMLLLADCEEASILRTEIDHYVILHAVSSTSTSEELCRRKYTRSHLGKPSYFERGVRLDQYTCYWNHHVKPRWMEHGEDRIPLVCPGAMILNCCDDCDENVDKLLQSGWFSSKHKPSHPNNEENDVSNIKIKLAEMTSSNDDDYIDEEEEEEEEHENADSRRKRTHRTIHSGPSVKGFLIATAVAATASALEPALRAMLLTVVLLVYWFWRGRS